LKTKGKNREFEEPLPLELPSVTGQPVWSFPGDVIENLRSLVTRIGKKDSFPARLSLVAALRGEGVTYTAQALATILAHDFSARVCLVDLNWWWPSSLPMVEPENPGVAAVLTGEADLDDVITPSGWSNLAFVSAGRLTKQDRPVISRSLGLKMLIDDLEARFNYLILDIPAILATNDSVPLASLGSACCLVVRHGVTGINDVQQALGEIDHLTVLGVVLNRVKLATPHRLVKLVSV